MKTGLSTPKKFFLLLAIFSIAFQIFLWRRANITETQRRIALVSRQRAVLDRERTEMEALRKKLDCDLDLAQRRETKALAELAKAKWELARRAPDSEWAERPAFLPQWNSSSPYVWLRKDLLPQLPVPVFTKTGELRDEVAAVLMIDPSERQRLEKNLEQLLGNFHELEKARATKVDQHLWDVEKALGPKVTVKVQPLPEEGAQFKQRFLSALDQYLGPQRAGLVNQIAAGWVDEQFSQFGNEPKIFSMARHPDGTFSLCIQSGGSKMSVGGPLHPSDYIPDHLMPLFADVPGSDEP